MVLTAIIALILSVNAPAQNTEPQLVMGTATNPLIKGDVPDISVVRVGNAYYMVSTTMYFMPVAPIMKSYDLVNWRIVSYVGDILEDQSYFRLEEQSNGRLGDYGRGQWAASLRYFKNRYWVIFKNNTTNRSYRYSTTDPDNGTWERVVINRGFHDPSIFYDEASNKIFIFHGADNISLTEMNDDLTGVKSGGIDKQILTDKQGFIGVGEGSQVYKRGNYYYVFTISWAPNRRSVHCFRSTKIDGPYEEKIVLNNAPSGGGGVAQGGIVDTPEGNWYGMFFQDRGPVGRIPFLVPMTWGSDDWPVFGTANTGNNNSVGTIPSSLQIKLAQNYETNLYYSDEFNYSSNKLHLAWQWNHNPDNDNWSVTERPGYLRLKTGRTSKTIYHARNTLTQRTQEPTSTAEVALETTSMKDGDIAGLVVLQAISGFVGIEQTGTSKNIVMYTGDNDKEAYRGKNAYVERKASVPFSGNKIYLRAVCNFGNNNNATFSYRTSETGSWTSIGTTVNPTFSLEHFTGVRFGLFNYATKTAGGYVDFDYYVVTPPGRTTPSSSSSSVLASSSSSYSVTCNLDNLDPSYVSGSPVPRPNVSCGTGVAVGTTFLFNLSGSSNVLEGWNSNGTHAFWTPGKKEITLSELTCDGNKVTLNPAVSCGSFEVVAESSSSSSEDATPITNHSPLSTLHSQLITYYSLKGEPLGSAKPQKAGIYIVKQGNSVKKIAVR